jgi:alpha-tubulin suppressor-like RCC1 family protein
MRHFLTLGFALLSSALAAPLFITPATQQTPPGGLVILSASEEVNWSSSGGILGSTHGTRVVLEAPRTGGSVTVTIQDPKDITRKAFAIVQVLVPEIVTVSWHTRTFAAGSSFSTAVSTDGSLWTWGLNDQFQVPGGKSNSVSIPIRVEGLSNLINVGAAHSLDASFAGVALSKNGTLWAWGSGHKTPASIDKNISYFDYNTCLITSPGDGTLSVSTRNGIVTYELKQVGYATTGEGTDSYDSSLSLAVISKTGAVSIADSCGKDVKVVGGLTDVKDISPVGKDLYIALHKDGSAVLIDNKSNVPIFRELAGFTNIHIVSSYLKRGGGGWGYAIMADGTVRGFELDDSGIPSVPKPVVGLTDIVDVSVSDSHALLLRKDGTLFAVGLNGDGELGNGTTQDSLTPVEVVGLKVALR